MCYHPMLRNRPSPILLLLELWAGGLAGQHGARAESAECPPSGRQCRLQQPTPGCAGCAGLCHHKDTEALTTVLLLGMESSAYVTGGKHKAQGQALP